MLTFGILYWVMPRIFKTELFSKRLANFHFWIATLGIIFYAVPMYWAGFQQASMWKQFTDAGQLKYQFIETVTYMKPFYAIRSFGGFLFVAGERRPIPFLIATLVVILIGGIIEIVPTFLIKSNVPTISSVKPYTPLELQGRDIYRREGCYTCHSQMVRPFRSETERYGEYSKAGEFVYDHPFQWGSKRTGPDLAREGTLNLKKTDTWHFNHMDDPQAISPGSIMPAYSFMLDKELDTASTRAKINAMRTIGVPYEEGYEYIANKDLMNQAAKIQSNLLNDSIRVKPNAEILAIIAYLQRLGTDIEKNKIAENKN
jgi:cytochrome c oxidase cbb3-type subunit I/II